MSDRAAKLLLSVADWIRLDDRGGETGTMAIGTGLAGEILAWSAGYKEHLAHVMERKEGIQKAKARAAAIREEMRNEEALARVREMAAAKDADNFACVMAAEALKLLGYEEKETK